MSWERSRGFGGVRVRPRRNAGVFSDCPHHFHRLSHPKNPLLRLPEGVTFSLTLVLALLHAGVACPGGLVPTAHCTPAFASPWPLFRESECNICFILDYLQSDLSPNLVPSHISATWGVCLHRNLNFRIVSHGSIQYSTQRKASCAW